MFIRYNHGKPNLNPANGTRLTAEITCSTHVFSLNLDPKCRPNDRQDGIRIEPREQFRKGSLNLLVISFLKASL